MELKIFFKFLDFDFSDSATNSSVEHQKEIILCNYDCCVLQFAARKTLDFVCKTALKASDINLQWGYRRLEFSFFP